MLLGAHQFIEALVWLWLQGHVPRGIGHVALWAYLLIAFVVLPVFIPLAVIALEPTGRRKAMMAPFALIGTVIAVILFAAMVRGPVGVDLAPYHLSYSIRVPEGLLIIALYVVAVCGPLLTSGYRNVVIFGAANLVAVIVITRLTVSGFASVWCAWAASLQCRDRAALPLRPTRYSIALEEQADDGNPMTLPDRELRLLRLVGHAPRRALSRLKSAQQGIEAGLEAPVAVG